MKRFFISLALLLLYNSLTAQKFPVILSAKNIDTFEVDIYKIKYHISNDSIKIDDLEIIDIEISSVYLPDEGMVYNAVLPEKEWIVVFFRDPEGNAKRLFLDTGVYSYDAPMKFVANFNTKKDYYVQYDPITKTYKGSEIDLATH